MSVLTKLKSINSSFTSTEKSISAFILNNRELIKELSSQTLAKRIGVSQSSIVKFTQKLGYKGYPALKIALAEAVSERQEQRQLHGDICLTDDIATLSSKLVSSKIAVIQETLQINDKSDFEQAVNMIVNAKRILLCGIGASGLVAKDFSQKLQKLGLPAIAEMSGHSQLAYAATFTAEDLVIVISESGTTADVVAVAKMSQQSAVNVLSITGVNRNTLRNYSDLCLSTVAESSEIRLSSILARTSQELVIDTLFLAMTQQSVSFRNQVQRSNAAVSDYVDKY